MGNDDVTVLQQETEQPLGLSKHLPAYFSDSQLGRTPHDPTRLNEKTSSLCIMALNVCGLTSKLSLGLLDNVLNICDIMCLSETKCSDIDPSNLPNHVAFFAEKPKVMSSQANPPLGGIHGLCVLVSKKIDDYCEMLADCTSNSVLWLKFSNKAYGKPFILGAVYIPHEGSKYYSNDIFDEINDDCAKIKSKYNIPLLLIGDFNARTGLLDDFLPTNELLEAETGLELLDDPEADGRTILEKMDVPIVRYNQDKHTNNNGYQLIDLCKTVGLHIMNGRCGLDRGTGKLTCADSSTIDYAVASPQLFDNISDFCIYDFDALLSDKHNLIRLTLKSDLLYQGDQCKLKVNPCPKFVTCTKWLPNSKKMYRVSFQNNEIIALAKKIQQSDAHCLTQTDLNTLTSEFKQLFINTAEKIGITKTVKIKRKSARKSNNKTWFNQGCSIARKEYARIKSHARKNFGLRTDSVQDAARKYKKVLRQAKKGYNNDIHAKLRNLKSSNPKDYWALLDLRKKTNCKPQVPLSTFADHFKKLSNAYETANSCEEASGESHETNDFINCPITLQELEKCVRKLKNNKSAGADLVINEFFKNCPQSVLILATALFNLVLNSELVPEEWSLGLIKPLYKGKGTRNCADNYRGITLLSCFGKLFTSVLNSRITDYLETNNILGQEQAGFRSGYSTTDHIFVLHSLIQLYQSKKKKLYCAFIDYRKAFDLIERSALWVKLLNNGINGKVLKVIKNMYTNAKSCVSIDHINSEFFTCNIGVRQGENLSPILFALFLNDFADFLNNHFTGLPLVTQLLESQGFETYVKLFTLLYADDTIMLADSAEELQNALEALKLYCDKWSLTVNAQKTKIVIFSRGKVRKFPKFYYDQTEIEVTDDYVYLGCTFNFNNKFNKARKAQVTHARRALFSLKHKAYDLDLPIDIQLELFDQVISPILLYGSEVWGFEDLTILEKFHLNFCKRVLGVHKYTPNSMVLRELGRDKLIGRIENRMINYWLKIASEKANKLTNIMYKLTRSLYDNDIYASNWLRKIHDILNDTGLTYIWDTDPRQISKTWFKQTLKMRLSDIHLQNLISELQANGQCTTYKLLKSTPENNLTFYLKVLDRGTRLPITKIRCVNNKLPIVTGRYQNLDRKDRICTLCNTNGTSQLGDEYHFVMECPYFTSLRKSLLNKYYTQRPSMLKMVELFNSTDPTVLQNLSKLCYKICNKFNC